MRGPPFEIESVNASQKSFWTRWEGEAPAEPRTYGFGNPTPALGSTPKLPHSHTCLPKSQFIPNVVPGFAILGLSLHIECFFVDGKYSH